MGEVEPICRIYCHLEFVGFRCTYNTVDVSNADKVEDVIDDGRGKWEDHKPRNESDRYNWEQCRCTFPVLRRLGADQSVDDPKLIADMPVDIQIVGGKFGEEKAVAVAKAVEDALKALPT